MNSNKSLSLSGWQATRLHIRRAFSWQLHSVNVTEGERAKLLNRGVTHDPLHRYAVWRRSVLLVVLVPSLIDGMLSTINLLSGGREGLTDLGKLLTIINTVVIWALPISTILAIRSWTSLRSSQRILIIGWILTFIPPFLIALVPADLWFHAHLSQDQATSLDREHSMLQTLNGLHVTLTLLPTVLAILPGLIRACLRVKTLLPAATLPGWFLVMTTPFYLLLVLVALIALNNLAGSPLLVLGMLFTMTGSMIYVWKNDLFIRPLSTSETPAINRAHQLSRIAGMTGALLLLAYLFTKKVFGLQLVGLHAQTSLAWLWENHRQLHLKPEQAVASAQSVFWIGEVSLFQLIMQYCGRTLFMTTVFADALVRMTMIAWDQTKRFDTTPAAIEYYETMEDMKRAITQK
ncbi:MAG TPA: hypothetical protein PLN21_12850 [Gemmatales bacterium]|nr:hypothetical protein [Gemmatales bacterium]